MNSAASLAARTAREDSYLPLTKLAAYSGLSVRTLRTHVNHQSRPLPCYRIGGKILVRQIEFDVWAEQFRVQAPARRLELLVNDVIAGLG